MPERLPVAGAACSSSPSRPSRRGAQTGAAGCWMLSMRSITSRGGPEATAAAKVRCMASSGGRPSTDDRRWLRTGARTRGAATDRRGGMASTGSARSAEAALSRASCGEAVSPWQAGSSPALIAGSGSLAGDSALSGTTLADAPGRTDSSVTSVGSPSSMRSSANTRLSGSMGTAVRSKGGPSSKVAPLACSQRRNTSRLTDREKASSWRGRRGVGCVHGRAP